MGNILSYFFPQPADDSIKQVVVDKNEGGETGRYEEDLPAGPAMEDVVVIVDEKVDSIADLVIGKEMEASKKDLIELSDEGFDFVEDSNFVIEGIEKIGSESKNCATLESVRNEVTEIAEQSICQDIENMGSKVDIIETFQERAEDYFDESDDESVDSQTLPDIETEYSYSSQPIEEHSEPIKLLTPESAKDLAPEPMKALTPEPIQTKEELPEFKLSEPSQLLPPEPPKAFSEDLSRPSFDTSKATTLASSPVFDPEIASFPASTELLDSLASPKPAESMERAGSSENVTAVDDISTEVEVIRGK